MWDIFYAIEINGLALGIYPALTFGAMAKDR
jgi:hypothetical protein